MYYQTQSKLAMSHQVFRHYTTIDVAHMIVKTGKFRMSCLKQLSDKREEEILDPVHKNKIYTFCWNHGERETECMWMKYGQGKKGVCLEFRNLEFMLQKERYRLPSNIWDIRDISTLDVIYLEGSEWHNVVRYQDPLNMGLRIPSIITPGYVKSAKYAHEEETRIRVYIDVVKGYPSIDFGKMKELGPNHPDIYNVPPFDFIYVDIGDQLRKNAIIRINPYVSDEEFDSIKRSILQYGVIPEEDIRRSLMK